MKDCFGPIKVRTRTTAMAALFAVAGAIVLPCGPALAKQPFNGHGVNERPMTWMGEKPWSGEDPVQWPGWLADLAKILDGTATKENDDKSLHLPPAPGDPLKLLPWGAPGAGAGDSFALPVISDGGKGQIARPEQATIPAPGVIGVLGVAAALVGRRRRAH